jgi:hypothetical protein
MTVPHYCVIIEHCVIYHYCVIIEYCVLTNCSLLQALVFPSTAFNFIPKTSCVNHDTFLVYISTKSGYTLFVKRKEKLRHAFVMYVSYVPPYIHVTL